MTWGCRPPERGEKERGAIRQPVLVTFPGSKFYKRLVSFLTREGKKEGGSLKKALIFALKILLKFTAVPTSKSKMYMCVCIPERRRGG